MRVADGVRIWTDGVANFFVQYQALDMNRLELAVINRRRISIVFLSEFRVQAVTCFGSDFLALVCADQHGLVGRGWQGTV